MLWDREAVQANIRNRDGRRVFFLGHGDQLTSAARDFLSHEKIEIRPGEQARIEKYRLLSGGILEEKPEHMTHLHGDILVPKTHPRITFRGAIDTLEAEIMLCQLSSRVPIREALGEILALARHLLRCEVLGEPLKWERLCGLTEAEQRERSHRPQAFYTQTHFIPDAKDGEALLLLNRCRCAARTAELAAAAAFTDQDGNPTRLDILRAMNRMSSMLYILMIQMKAEGGSA